MAAYPEASLISEFADAALTFAQRLLEVEATTGHNVSLVRRRTRAGLLDMLLHGRGAAPSSGERLYYHGIEPDRALAPAGVLGRRGRGQPPRPPVGRRRRGRRAAGARSTGCSRSGGVPFLSRRSRGQVLVLAPLAEHEDAAAVLRSVTEPRRELPAPACAPTRIDVGFSSAMSGLDMVPRAAGQARLALRHADRRAAGPPRSSPSTISGSATGCSTASATTSCRSSRTRWSAGCSTPTVAATAICSRTLESVSGVRRVGRGRGGRAVRASQHAAQAASRASRRSSASTWARPAAASRRTWGCAPRTCWPRAGGEAPCRLRPAGGREHVVGRRSPADSAAAP